MVITLITIVHVFVCLVLVGVVLLQQGKGADMGATFGGGSQTLFGASGADNLLTRVTTVCAAVFMITSIILALSSKHAISGGSSLFENMSTQQSTKSATEAPAAPAATAPATTTAPSENAAAPAAPAAPLAGNPTPDVAPLGAAPTEAAKSAAPPAAPAASTASAPAAPSNP